jgi:hypothetical protein
MRKGQWRADTASQYQPLRAAAASARTQNISNVIWTDPALGMAVVVRWIEGDTFDRVCAIVMNAFLAK